MMYALQMFPMLSSIFRSLAEKSWEGGRDFREGIYQLGGLDECIAGAVEFNAVRAAFYPWHSQTSMPPAPAAASRPRPPRRLLRLTRQPRLCQLSSADLACSWRWMPRTTKGYGEPLPA